MTVPALPLLSNALGLVPLERSYEYVKAMRLKNYECVCPMHMEGLYDEE